MRSVSRRATLAIVALLLAAAGALAPEVAGAINVYVTGLASNSVSPFSTTATGALTPIACSQLSACSTGPKPKGIAIDPTGSYAYVANSNSASPNPSSVSIAPGGGLAPIACDPSTACALGEGSADGIAVDPSGRFVYVASTTYISVFSINPGGSLTPVTCSPLTDCFTDGGSALAIEPSGHYLYAADSDGDWLRVFSIGPTGALTPVPCNLAACGAGDDPWAIAVDPGGKFVYSIDRNPPHGVHAFSIEAGGVLAPIPCPVATDCVTGTYPDDIAVDPTGRFVYVTGNDDDSLSVLAINQPATPGTDGALTPVTCNPGSACKTGADSEGLAVDPAGEHVYVSNRNDDSVAVYSIGPTGSLTPVSCDPATACKTGDAPNHFALEVRPDRGPTAAFSGTAAADSNSASFNAAASSSPDYPIVTYAWSFGDGASKTTSGPTVAHTYDDKGTFTVTLTVTDAAGCSRAVVYTGQTASCNGAAKARATHPITVPASSAACGEAKAKLAKAKKKLRKAKRKLKKLVAADASDEQIARAMQAVKKAKKAVMKAKKAVRRDCD
jgi:6-phosphogluconolactonase